ncbi:hypothetical protein Tco_1187814 [Tanacetum coccineum]
MSLAYRKLCVKTKPNVIINDKIKAIVKGQVFWIRVKELKPCTPDFSKELGDSSSSDEEYGDDEEEQKSGNKESIFASAKETEIDLISELSYVHVNDLMYENHDTASEHAKKSEDPSRIYKILKRNNDKEE